MKKRIVSGIAAFMMIAGAVAFAANNTTTKRMLNCDGGECCSGVCTSAKSLGAKVAISSCPIDDCCICSK
jgi:hypothetical protein